MKLLNYLKGLLYFFIPFFLLIILITTFYYFDILNNQIIKYFKIIILLLSTFISGIYIGKNSLNKGYLSGIILSLIIVLIFFITNLFLDGFKIYQLIYYLIIILTTTIGAMFGINRKKEK